LDDDFDRMRIGCRIPEGPWARRGSNSYFAEENTIDCYRYFITDEMIDLRVCETNRYAAEQYLPTHDMSRRSTILQWKPIPDAEMLTFLGIIIEMGLLLE
jgi:hypothetical protein